MVEKILLAVSVTLLFIVALVGLSTVGLSDVVFLAICDRVSVLYLAGVVWFIGIMVYALIKLCTAPDEPEEEEDDENVFGAPRRRTSEFKILTLTPYETIKAQHKEN